MTVLQPRSHMISVRLSKEECSMLRRLCVASGARSMSDFARTAMLSLIKDARRDEASILRAQGNNSEITYLQQRIDKLAEEVAHLKGREDRRNDRRGRNRLANDVDVTLEPSAQR
jgi:Arc/MetJ-type ribon-helix-helix transcriptional regulator